MLFQIGYVGSEGRHLLTLLNINQPFLGGPTTDVTYNNAVYPGVTDRPFLRSVSSIRRYQPNREHRNFEL